MITPMTIYLMTCIGGIDVFCSLMATFLYIAALILSVGGLIMLQDAFLCGKDDNNCKKVIRYAKMTAIGAIVCTVLAILTPSTKEMAAIVVIPKVANSESVQSLGASIVNLANQWLVDLSPSEKAVK